MIRLSSLQLFRQNKAQTSQLLIRLVIVAGLLLLSTYLGLKGSINQIRMLFYLLVGGVAVLAFVRWPPLGLIAAIVGGMFIPNLAAGGMNISVIIISLLLILWLIDMVVRKREVQLVSSRTLWPALVLIVIATISFGFGQLPWFTFVQSASIQAQFGGYLVFILSAGVFLLVANQVREIGWLKWMVWVFLFFAAWFVLGSRIPGYGPTILNTFQRVGSVFWIWMVALSLSQAIFNKELQLRWRTVLLFIAVATLYIAFFHKFADKSSWVPATIATFVIVALRSWRAGVALALAGALLIWSYSSHLASSEEYSLSTRIDAWLIMAEIVKANPLFGLGFGNYYWYTPLFSIRGWAVEFNSHNNYVDIIAQTGLVGMACYLWFFSEVSLLSLRLRKFMPGSFAQAYIVGALGGIAGMLVTGMLGDWVLPFVYNITLGGYRSSMLGWMFLGGLVVIARIYRDQGTIE